MGRQSSRIFFQGKDHKEIFFRGHYHKAAYIGNQLVWEKLADFVGKYWIYVRLGSNRAYSHAALKPSDKIREYWSLRDLLPIGLASAKTYFMHNDKCFIYMARTTDTIFCRGFLVSRNGVQWDVDYIDTSILGRYVYSIVPKWDGVIFANCINPISDFNAGNSYEYRYCPIKNGKVDQENSVLLYTDSRTGKATGMTIENTVDFSDILILFNMYGNGEGYEAFAIDINGNVYNNLFTLPSYSYTYPHGCFQGMYWIIVDGDVYKTKNPYIAWEKKSVFGLTFIGVIQTEDYIIVFGRQTISTPTGDLYETIAYTTKDFETYQQVELPSTLLVPIIGERYSDEIKYVECRLSGATTGGRDDAYIVNPAASTIYFSRMRTGQAAYVDDGKIAPFNGMLFKIGARVLTDYDSEEITVYIDNPFFAESEGNFAICEELYPNEVVING